MCFGVSVSGTNILRFLLFFRFFFKKANIHHFSLHDFQYNISYIYDCRSHVGPAKLSARLNFVSSPTSLSSDGEEEEEKGEQGEEEGEKDGGKG